MAAVGRIYVAGPMRGHDLFNFPAFDEAAGWLGSRGWVVISPADLDRSLGLDETLYPELPDWFTIEDAMMRDLHEITHPLMNAVALLPGWAKSEGSRKEVTTAIHCGLDIYLYEAAGVFASYDKRLVSISHQIAKFMMRSAEESSTPDAAVGQKAQNDIRYDLIPREALEEVAKVYGHGAKKYAPNNWKLGYEYSKSAAALDRHWAQWLIGYEDDEEGFKHLAAVIFHACTLIYRDKLQREWDDVHFEPGQEIAA